MNDSRITIAGNVATKVVHRELDDGRHVTNFRVASTRRHRDRRTGEWRDGHTSFYNVSCWRSLAQNVALAVEKGDPVVVVGDIRLRDWENGERRGTTGDIEAIAVGHDLNRGVSQFRRVTRAAAAPLGEDDRRVLAEMEAELGPDDAASDELLAPVVALGVPDREDGDEGQPEE